MSFYFYFPLNTGLGTVSGYKLTYRFFFFCQTLLKKSISSIEQYILRILAFLPFRFSKKFSYFVFELLEGHFFSSLVNKQLGRRAWKRG